MPIACGPARVICVTANAVHVVEHQAHKNALKGTGDLFIAELKAGLLRGLPLDQAEALITKLQNVLFVEEGGS